MKYDPSIEGLKHNSLFSSLTDAELQDIRGKIILKKIKRNEIILREEHTNEFMYIILDGGAKVIQTTDAGKEIIVTLHKAGDFFGELSLIDGKTAPAAVRATRDSQIAIISKQEFFSMIKKQEKILDNLLQILCSRIRESMQKIQILNFNNAAQRVQMLLMMLAESHGEKTREGTILQLKLIHQDIADMTGLTRETVTRVLDKWRRGGEIKILPNKSILLTPEFESILF